METVDTEHLRLSITDFRVRGIRPVIWQHLVSLSEIDLSSHLAQTYAIHRTIFVW